MTEPTILQQAMRRTAAQPGTTAEERLEAVALNAVTAAMHERGQTLYDGMLIRRIKLITRGLIDIPDASPESLSSEVISQRPTGSTPLLDKLNAAAGDAA